MYKPSCSGRTPVSKNIYFDIISLIHCRVMVPCYILFNAPRIDCKFFYRNSYMQIGWTLIRCRVLLSLQWDARHKWVNVGMYSTCPKVNICSWALITGTATVYSNVSSIPWLSCWTTDCKFNINWKWKKNNKQFLIFIRYPTHSNVHLRKLLLRVYCVYKASDCFRKSCGTSCFPRI